MKSIKNRITALIISMVILLCTIFGVSSCFLNYRTAAALLEQNLSETAIVAGNHVGAEIKAIQAVAIQTGCTARLAKKDSTVAEKKALIDQTAKNYGFQRGDIINAQGVSIFDVTNYSERDYYKASMKGETYISDPAISEVTGKLSFLISAPLWENGIPGTKVIGVVYFVPPEQFLNEIVSDINVSKTGTAFLLNKKGTTVADRDPALVSVNNHIEEAKTNSDVAEVAAVHTKMINGEKGYGTYRHEGAKWVEGYAPVPNTNGWSIGVMAQEKDFLSEFYLAFIVTVVITVLFLIGGIAASMYLGNQIGHPISRCVKRLEQLANGDLNSPVPVIKAKDETGVLSKTTVQLKEKLEAVVREVSHNLTEMAGGNLNLPDLRAYSGDFLPLSTSSNQIISSLNDAVSQINVSSDQVSSGSDQVASGAQALSQGATEQASSIEELSASIVEISQHVKDNAENARSANEIAGRAGQKLYGGNEEMQRMLSAMSEIAKSSNQIGNIIKTINDIAFQTNILALNAAVEAARAGAAGKGFAVVADEVRNLASKSADAAKSTTELIGNSIRAVENGRQLADNTAKILQEVMAEAKKSTELIGDIAVASDVQSQSIAQITLGIEQIAAVVQTNSATAEESAAASEELSGQAQMLKTLVGRFTLKTENSTSKAHEMDYSVN